MRPARRQDLPGAIFAYNHADWYVDEVLLYARQYANIPGDLVSSITGLTEGARFPVAANSRYADDALNWLPIGGFVKLEGEDGDSADDPRSFSVQPWWKKMVILVAGVVMNILLAFAIFTGIALGGDPTIGVAIGAVQPDSPAATAGLVAGDEIVSIDGEYFNALGGSNLRDELQTHAGETVELGIQHPDGTTSTVTVTLRDAAAVAAGEGALGVSNLSAVTTDTAITYTPIEAIQVGWQRTVDALGLIWRGLGELVSSVATDPTQPPPVAGPVGIATQIGDVFWQLGPVVTLYVAGSCRPTWRS